MGMFSYVGKYFSTLGRAVAGAMGAEFARGGARIARDAYTQVRTRTCPRCFEHSLSFDHAASLYKCARTDICGFAGSKDAVKRLEEQPLHIAPIVFAIAKGESVDLGGQYYSCKRFSWVIWGCSLLVVVYGFWWAFEGSLFFSVWSFLIGVALAINAIKLAYRAQRLRGAFTERPSAFLHEPRMWFVC